MKAIAIDTETTGLDYLRTDLMFMTSVCDEKYTADTFEFAVDPLTRFITYGQSCAESQKHKELKLICEDEGTIKVFFNAKFDINMLKNACIDVRGEIRDVAFMARTYKSNIGDKDEYALKPLSKRYLGLDHADESDLQKLIVSLRRRAKRLGYKIAEKVQADYWLTQMLSDDDPQRWLCSNYCQKDAARTMALYKFYLEKMPPERWEACEFEHKFFPVVLELEHRGMAFFPEKAKEAYDLCVEKVAYHEAECRRIACNSKLEVSSNPQVSTVIYDHMGLEVLGYTKSGNPSVDIKALLHHKEDDFVQNVLQYRMYDKGLGLFTKYIDLSIPDTVVPGGYCIKSKVHQTNTRTWRLSSSEPNLEQVPSPVSTTNPMGVVDGRVCFGPRPGYVWYLYDYEQQELRIFASVANVGFLIQAFRRGDDAYSIITNRMWGGKFNQLGVDSALVSLELGNPNASDELKKLWKEYGWRESYHPRGTEARMIVDDWLADFDYDIVKAEKSIGKKMTRSRCKACVLAKLYGGGWAAVQFMLGTDEYESREFMQMLDQALPEARPYSNRLMRQALRDGYIKTPYGTYIDVPADHAYKCVDYICQGTAACMMKRAMLEISDFYKDTGLDAHIIMPEHDELITEVKIEDSYTWLVQGTRNILESHGKIVGVPMPVEIAKCKSQWSIEESYA